MKYIWISGEGIGLSIAHKLILEGNEVLVGMVDDLSLIGGKEDDDKRKRRKSLYKGILEIEPAERLLKTMKKMDNKDDWFVVFDFNDLYPLAEQALKMGFTKGLFPTKEDHDFEADRNKAKAFVEEHYRHLKVAEVNEFKTVDEALGFLEESEEFYVLKGNDENAKTVVPDTENIEFNHAEIVDSLTAHQKDYESKGFLLEKKIMGIEEATPGIMFWNGEPISTMVDIENKGFGGGNCGVQTGCSQNLIVKTNLEDPINKMAFPLEIFKMAAKHTGLFVWDASLLHKDGEYYFGEFCPNRFGWDSVFSEIAMAGSASEFFEAIAEGRNPYQKTFGVAVRGFNQHRGPAEKGGRVLDGVTMNWDDDEFENIWVYDMMKEDEKYVSAGTDWDLVVFTGASNDAVRATELAYKALRAFSFDRLYYRPMYDFLSCAYQSSIMNRYGKFNDNLFFQESIDEVAEDEYHY